MHFALQQDSWNGGWVNFEGAKGLTRIKHPCMHVGDGMGGKRDDLTGNLFETTSPPA